VGPTLGTLRLASPFVLAPMESVSDAAFRRLCWEAGAALTFTEMVRARGLVRNNRSTVELIDSVDPEVPTGLQLLVTGAAELEAALGRLEALAAGTHPHLRNLQVVDLNFGCPSPEVIRVGAGPALLKRRHKLEAIFSALAAWRRRTALPVRAVGAKIRLGLNRQEQDRKVYLGVAEAAGAHLDYLVVHARHARQESGEPPTWSAIAEVKARAGIPVFGNGDVVTLADFQRLQRETGADGAMVARGAIRSPLVFRGLLGLGPGSPTGLAEVEALERRYLELAARFGTRPKYLAWHREGFARMRARLEAGQSAESDQPTAAPMG
jgi:tRNA-dihydrouridine synthase B